MAQTDVVLRVSVAWWLYPYLAALALACALTGREPDWVKLQRKVERALTIKGIHTAGASRPPRRFPVPRFMRAKHCRSDAPGPPGEPG